MINKFSGRCSTCEKSIPSGTEVRYDSEAKQIQHWECYENPKPRPEDYKLADKLGFKRQPSGSCFHCLLPLTAIQPSGRDPKHLDGVPYGECQQAIKERTGNNHSGSSAI